MAIASFESVMRSWQLSQIMSGAFLPLWLIIRIIVEVLFLGEAKL
jgi:hypothetical protein